MENENEIIESNVRALFDAIGNNDSDRVRALLAERTPVNVFCNRITPLSAAVRKGNREIVRLLLDVGADPNLVNSEKPAPLYDAVSEWNYAKLRGMGMHNIRNPLQYHKFRATWLRKEYRGEYDSEIVQMLLDAGADVNRRATCCSGDTPLHVAALSGRSDVVDMLLAKGADVCLSRIELGYKDILRKLRERGRIEDKGDGGFDRLITDIGGWVPERRIDMLVSVFLMDEEEEIIQLGFNIWEAETTETLLLDMIARRGNVTMVEMLLQAGAPIPENFTMNDIGPLVEEDSRQAILDLFRNRNLSRLESGCVYTELDPYSGLSCRHLNDEVRDLCIPRIGGREDLIDNESIFFQPAFWVGGFLGLFLMYIIYRLFSNKNDRLGEDRNGSLRAHRERLIEGQLDDGLRARNVVARNQHAFFNGREVREEVRKLEAEAQPEQKLEADASRINSQI